MLGGCWWLKGSRKPEKEIKQKDKKKFDSSALSRSTKKNNPKNRIIVCSVLNDLCGPAPVQSHLLR